MAADAMQYDDGFGDGFRYFSGFYSAVSHWYSGLGCRNIKTLQQYAIWCAYFESLCPESVTFRVRAAWDTPTGLFWILAKRFDRPVRQYLFHCPPAEEEQKRQRPGHYPQQTAHYFFHNTNNGEVPDAHIRFSINFVSKSTM